MCLEALESGGLPNASALWRQLGSKWDIEKAGVIAPIEVKTTARNTHTHELRHSQLEEGRACGLRIYSIRCSADISDSVPTLGDMLEQRKEKAVALGRDGLTCVGRVDLELARLSQAERSLRLIRQGQDICLPVAELPVFPNFAAEYREVKYTVTLPSAPKYDSECVSVQPTYQIYDKNDGVDLEKARNSLLGKVPTAILDSVGATRSNQHIASIQWAIEHNRQGFSWGDLRTAEGLLGCKLLSAAKGIYKAEGTPWVRSVRHSPEGAYGICDVDGSADESCWYSFERGDVERKRTGPLRYRVEVVWVTEFDHRAMRCLLNHDPLDTVPDIRDDLARDLSRYTNRALWLNYRYQIPLILLRGL
jgi:hypothetical protein